MFCPTCGKEISDAATTCPSCGTAVGTASAGGKSKLVAGLLGIFLGGFGIHRFYLGYTTIGVVQIVVTLVTFGIGGLWGFIEGILILTGNIDRDAAGQPLAN